MWINLSTGGIIMVNFLLTVQILMVIFQGYVLVSGIIKKEDLYEYYKGFALWGCIPSILFTLIILMVS